MRRKHIGVILLALGLIALGLVMVGVQVFGLNIRWFAGWWTVLIAVAALISMVNRGIRFWNFYALLFSVVTFARWQELVLKTWQQYFATLGALALILLGIFLIVNMLRPKKNFFQQVQADINEVKAEFNDEWQEVRDEIRDEFQPPQPNGPYTGEEFPTRFALFSSEVCRSDCKRLRGGRFSAIFGAVTADLRTADFDAPITVECNSLFGGIDLFVPSNVRVECTGTSIFGGCGAKALAGRPYDPNHPVLTVRYLNIFGGTEIK